MEETEINESSPKIMVTLSCILGIDGNFFLEFLRHSSMILYLNAAFLLTGIFETLIKNTDHQYRSEHTKQYTNFNYNRLKIRPARSIR